MHSVDIDNIAVTIPDELDGSKRMIPSEIHSADQPPVVRQVRVSNGNLYSPDREYPARAQSRNAFGSAFPLVSRITVYDLLSFLGRVMQGLLDRHSDDATIWRLLLQEPPHDIAHAQQ